MAIPLVIILGLACTFYIYVAMRWWSVAMVAKREEKRASAIVRLFANVPEDHTVSVPFRHGRTSSANSGIRQAGYQNPSVIVMNRARVGK